MEEKESFEQQNIFGEPVMIDQPKRAKHAGRRVKAKSGIVEEELAGKENTVIIESIKIAEVAAKDQTRPYYPHIVQQSVVATGNIDKMLINNAATTLREAEVAEEELALQENRKAITMTEDILMPIVQRAGLTAYDRAVLEAIYSELMASKNTSNPIFTLRSLFRTMCGDQTKKANLTETQRKQLMSTVLNLMSTVVSVEVKGVTGKGEAASFKKYLPLLPCVIDEINYGGSITTAIRVTAMPPFLAFADGKKGIAAMPLEMLQIPNFSSTARNLSIVNYLQHKYMDVVHGSDSEERRRQLLNDDNEFYVDYAALYEVADSKPLAETGNQANKSYNNTYTMRVRDIVHQILDSWVTRKYLESWRDVTDSMETYKKGAQRPICGVMMKLPEKIPSVDDT